MREYTKPWKLITFGMGMIWLIAGSFLTEYPDWDIGICFVMGISTYLAHPYALRFKTFDDAIVSAFLCLFCVDTFYSIYWSIKNPLVLQLMRSAQWQLSLCYYLAAVAVWNYGERIIESSSSRLVRFLHRLQADPDLIAIVKCLSGTSSPSVHEEASLPPHIPEPPPHMTAPSEDYLRQLRGLQNDVHNQIKGLENSDQGSASGDLRAMPDPFGRVGRASSGLASRPTRLM